MTSIASERNWLFDPNLLKLVHQCRRLIHTEFGIKLHLTDAKLEHQLADYASKSRSSQLTRVWETLKDQIPGYTEAPKTAQSAEGTGKRVYRGQVIEEEADPTKSAGLPETGFEAMTATKKKVIYRGQVMG